MTMLMSYGNRLTQLISGMLIYDIKMHNADRLLDSLQ
jgi:hypothetical protein